MDDETRNTDATRGSGLNAEAIARYASQAARGPVVMLNLLRYKADGGRESYADYMVAVAPVLAGVGGRVTFMGEPDELVIGHEEWDLMLLVEYPTRSAFLAMIESSQYQAISHLRERALERSVLYAMNPTVR